VAFAAAGAATVTVNGCDAAVVPVAVIDSGFGVQVTPGGSAEQVIFAVWVPVEPAAGVMVIVDVPVPLLPAVAGESETAVPPIVKPPVPLLLAKVKFRILFPPNATGLGSAWPKELTMMKYVVPEVTARFVNCDCVTIPATMSSLQANTVKLPADPVQIESTLS